MVVDLSVFAVRFQSTDLICSSPVLRPSSFASDHLVFFARFRSFNLLRSLPTHKSFSYVSGLSTVSVLPAIPTFRLVGFCLRDIQVTLMNADCQNPKTGV